MAKGFPGATEIEASSFFGLECDICIPAALGSQITAANAGSIKAVVIAEGANGPTDPEGEAISGGVIGSYFEWLQNKQGEIWQMDDVIGKLDKKMEISFNRVIGSSVEYDTDLRTAAYIEAIKRIELAYMQRGVFP